ncbi:MAG TPA: hypothetical protein VEX67_19070 [Solirubrobacteraceae bacterium]|nr:hypothetical protein [Solirubrobacteraceae bacterium]
MGRLRAPALDRSATARPRPHQARPHQVLDLQRKAGNRAVCALLAREPKVRRRWGEQAGEATYLELSPTLGRLHLPDTVLHTWADGANKVKGLPLEGAVLNSLKLVNPTLRFSTLLGGRLSGHGVLSWDTGNPFASPTEVDLEVAVWRQRGTLRIDTTAEAMGLQGEVRMKVKLPKHQDGDLEDIWKDLQKDLEQALREAAPNVKSSQVKAEVMGLLGQLLAGQLDQQAFVKALTAAVKRLAKGASSKPIEKALWTALSKVFPKIEAKIRVRSPVGTITKGSAHAKITPEGPKADLTVGGVVVAPPGKVTSTLAPVLGVYGERLELGKRRSFQAGLLQKLDPDAIAKPGSTLAEKLPTALYGEYTYTRETESGYELSVTFSVKFSSDELGAIGRGPQTPDRNDMFSPRVRDSLKQGGGRDEYGREPMGGDVPTMVGVTISGTHGIGEGGR